MSRLYDTKQEIRGVFSINPGIDSILIMLKTIAISLALIVDMMAERRCGMSKSIFKMCPFCGRREVVRIETIEDWFGNDKYKVVCGDEDYGCGASSAWFYSEEEAVEAWNRRVG